LFLIARNNFASHSDSLVKEESPVHLKRVNRLMQDRQYYDQSGSKNRAGADRAKFIRTAEKTYSACNEIAALETRGRG
jgi:hypothetical protein